MIWKIFCKKKIIIFLARWMNANPAVYVEINSGILIPRKTCIRRKLWLTFFLGKTFQFFRNQILFYLLFTIPHSFPSSKVITCASLYTKGLFKFRFIIYVWSSSLCGPFNTGSTKTLLLPASARTLRLT